MSEPHSKLNRSSMWNVIVIGAGAAGLLAATRAAERGRSVFILEKNRKPGVKILMSGGTRCNITHATDSRGIVAAYGPPGRFLHSSLAALSPQDVVDLFHAEGVLTKIEETGKVFPVSNKSVDVQQALLRRLARTGAQLLVQASVTQVLQNDDGHFVVRYAIEGDDSNDRYEVAEKLILTTGGQSYPGCGTTGDGYAWAKQFGHSIVATRPALVPLVSEATWVRDLSGVTLPDVVLKLVAPGQSKPVTQCRDSLLFTHFGFSGPAALNVSRAVGGPANPLGLGIECDFLPETPVANLTNEFVDAARHRGTSTVVTDLAERLPRRLIEALLTQAGIPLPRKWAELSKSERQKLIQSLKQKSIPLQGTLGFEKAEVTTGGVALSEVDSRTMQSKIVKNLYFAGEILDLDGPIGGFNFQAAFSTAWLAAENV